MSMSSSAIRPSLSATVLATLFFVSVSVTLGYLGNSVIVAMRDTSNAMDDERSVKTAQAAVNSLKTKLADVLRDNAEWDDAYAASQNGTLAEFARTNWGIVSADYELYDGTVIRGADGQTLISMKYGEPVELGSQFGDPLSRQAEAAASAPDGQLIDFISTQRGVMLTASQAIRPHASEDRGKPYATLSFVLDLHPSDIAALGEHYLLRDLRLTTVPSTASGTLSIPLQDSSGRPVAYLEWKSLTPGTSVYEKVGGQVNAIAAILAIFLVTVVLAGGAETHRMARLARRANHEATHDALSGLLNRSGLIGGIRSRILGNEALTLHILDLDGFKGVNDAWGHQIGDRLIMCVANALSQCHPDAALVARFGGDEFAVVQHGSASPAEFAKAILHVFDTVFDIDGRAVEVGASIGYASSADVEDPFELLRRADIALYRAKDDGKRRAVAYHPELDRERERLLHLEDDLRRDIAGGGVTVVYQPLVSAASGKLNGVEALARWLTDRGPVSPEIFIPLAERSGLIDQLGMHVLRQSVRDAAEWPTLKLSVNVSPIQLCNPAFASGVAALLHEEGFDPARLTLEITEGVLMTNPDQAQRAIDELRKIGVRFSLDDFGCGYASIGALRQFGFDSMKIDRSLVWAADTEGKGQDVLRATIALATALSIPVTAEGIETQTQANILREAGCDQLQGYMVGRPMSAKDITELDHANAA